MLTGMDPPPPPPAPSWNPRSAYGCCFQHSRNAQFQTPNSKIRVNLWDTNLKFSDIGSIPWAPPPPHGKLGSTKVELFPTPLDWHALSLSFHGDIEQRNSRDSRERTCNKLTTNGAGTSPKNTTNLPLTSCRSLQTRNTLVRLCQAVCLSQTV